MFEAFLLMKAFLFSIYIFTFIRTNPLFRISFVNLSIIYYFTFAVVPTVARGLSDSPAMPEISSDWLTLWGIYGILLTKIGVILNLRFAGARGLVSAVPLPTPMYSQQRIKSVMLAVIAIKLFLVATSSLTPLQLLLFTQDIEDAHRLQSSMHSAGRLALTKTFYSLFSVPLSAIFLVSIGFLKSKKWKLLAIFLAFETAGWYLSKSAMVVPAVALLIKYYLLDNRKVFVVIIGTILLAYLSFYIRALENQSFSELGLSILRRIDLEIGYSHVHLEILKLYNVPLFFTDRYYLGFNTLFDVVPAVRYSHEAFFLATGKSTGTSSGFAPVGLYAFWGNGWPLAAIVGFIVIFSVDIYVLKKCIRARLILAYLAISLFFINAITVDQFRLIDYRFILDPRLLVSLMFVSFFVRLIRRVRR